MNQEVNQPRDRSHDDAMVEAFRADPAYALALLNDILKGDAEGELSIALRQMTKAFGHGPDTLHPNEAVQTVFRIRDEYVTRKYFSNPPDPDAGRKLLEILDSTKDNPHLPWDELED